MVGSVAIPSPFYSGGTVRLIHFWQFKDEAGQN